MSESESPLPADANATPDAWTGQILPAGDAYVPLEQRRSRASKPETGGAAESGPDQTEAPERGQDSDDGTAQAAEAQRAAAEAEAALKADQAARVAAAREQVRAVEADTGEPTPDQRYVLDTVRELIFREKDTIREVSGDLARELSRSSRDGSSPDAWQIQERLEAAAEAGITIDAAEAAAIAELIDRHKLRADADEWDSDPDSDTEAGRTSREWRDTLQRAMNAMIKNQSPS